MELSTDLHDFLVARRARLDPETAGVQPSGGRRRVAGLRREEVAYLAGVSVDYYTRFERGRSKGVSSEVVDSVARALRLDDVAHEHLRNLVDRSRVVSRPSGTRPSSVPRRVPAGLQAVLDAIEVPAFIQNEWFDLLAANNLGAAIYPVTDVDRDKHGVANLAQFFFLNSRAVDFYRDREQVARNTVAMLRAAAGRHPDDESLITLIGNLSAKSTEFRQLWAVQDVIRFRSGPKRYTHPLVGELDFTYQTFEIPAHPGFTMLVYSVEPGSPTHEAIRLLASWIAVPVGTDYTSESEPSGSATTA